MIFLPLFTAGLAGFVPPLWAASKRKHDREFVRRMRLLASVIGVVTFVGMVLISAAPVDSAGTPIGAASDIGGYLLLGVIIGSMTVAVRNRKPPPPALAGTARELANRGQRAEYRKLIASDPSLARGIFVGRPDLRRDYDDGGLLDLNHLTADQLVQFGHVAAAEAESIVDARAQLGQFSTIEEVMVYANLSEVSASGLRERAVFL